MMIKCPNCKESTSFEVRTPWRVTWRCPKCNTKYRIRFDGSNPILRENNTISQGEKDVEVKGMTVKQKHASLRAKSISEKRWLSTKKKEK